MNNHLYGVIMAGGGGTRLWPLSRAQHPKQMLRLSGERTLFQISVDRLLPLLPLNRIYVVTAEEQVDALVAQYPQLPRENFISEPVGRGTAPCIGLAALHIRHLDPEAVMVVVTADHHIKNVDAFIKSLEAGAALAAEGHLVTLGVTPTFPSIGYGYIRFGEKLRTVAGVETYKVAAFTEKPDREHAERFLEEGVYAWNSGMFIWRADRILEEIDRWMPELHSVLTELDAVWQSDACQVQLAELWPQLDKQMIDYGVMERAARVAVIPVDMGWSDIGTWASVMDMYAADDEGNVMSGDVIALETENTMVLGRGQRLVVAVGLDDIIVVDTPDATLIMRRDMSQQVREVVDRLRSEGREGLL